MTKETDPVSETLCSLEYKTVDKVQRPCIPESKITSLICLENESSLFQLDFA
jgi:hypothetical protein